MTKPVIVGDDTTTEQTTSTSTTPKNQLSTFGYFQTPVYKVEKTEYLDPIRTVMTEKINEVKKTRKMHPLYPVFQTDNMFGDPRIKEFVNYVGSTAWNILDGQGYAMNNMTVYFQEMWGQEHHKHSLHEEHVHGAGCQLVGFYFLDTPDECSRLVIHDPRPAKRLVNLPEKNVSQVTIGSTAINFEPHPGDLFFVPSWVPHSFGRHGSKKPIRFLHFTIGVSYQQPTIDVDTGLPPELPESAEVV
jgi:hypothetical protein